jgi:hypothetical protein
MLQCPIGLGTIDAFKERLREPVPNDVIHVF